MNYDILIKLKLPEPKTTIVFRGIFVLAGGAEHLQMMITSTRGIEIKYQK